MIQLNNLKRCFDICSISLLSCVANLFSNDPIFLEKNGLIVNVTKEGNHESQK